MKILCYTIIYSLYFRHLKSSRTGFRSQAYANHSLMQHVNELRNQKRYFSSLLQRNSIKNNNLSIFENSVLQDVCFKEFVNKNVKLDNNNFQKVKKVKDRIKCDLESLIEKEMISEMAKDIESENDRVILLFELDAFRAVFINILKKIELEMENKNEEKKKSLNINKNILTVNSEKKDFKDNTKMNITQYCIFNKEIICFRENLHIKINFPDFKKYFLNKYMEFLSKYKTMIHFSMTRMPLPNISYFLWEKNCVSKSVIDPPSEQILNFENEKLQDKRKKEKCKNLKKKDLHNLENKNGYNQEVKENNKLVKNKSKKKIESGEKNQEDSKKIADIFGKNAENTKSQLVGSNFISKIKKEVKNEIKRKSHVKNINTPDEEFFSAINPRLVRHFHLNIASFALTPVKENHIIIESPVKESRDGNDDFENEIYIKEKLSNTITNEQNKGYVINDKYNDFDNSIIQTNNEPKISPIYKIISKNESFFNSKKTNEDSSMHKIKSNISKDIDSEVNILNEGDLLKGNEFNKKSEIVLNVDIEEKEDVKICLKTNINNEEIAEDNNNSAEEKIRNKPNTVLEESIQNKLYDEQKEIDDRDRDNESTFKIVEYRRKNHYKSDTQFTDNNSLNFRKKQIFDVRSNLKYKTDDTFKHGNHFNENIVNFTPQNTKREIDINPADFNKDKCQVKPESKNSKYEIEAYDRISNNCLTYAHIASRNQNNESDYQINEYLQRNQFCDEKNRAFIPSRSENQSSDFKHDSTNSSHISDEKNTIEFQKNDSKIINDNITSNKKNTNKIQTKFDAKSETSEKYINPDSNIRNLNKKTIKTDYKRKNHVLSYQFKLPYNNFDVPYNIHSINKNDFIKDRKKRKYYNRKYYAQNNIIERKSLPYHENNCLDQNFEPQNYNQTQNNSILTPQDLFLLDNHYQKHVITKNDTDIREQYQTSLPVFQNSNMDHNNTNYIINASVLNQSHANQNFNMYNGSPYKNHYMSNRSVLNPNLFLNNDFRQNPYVDTFNIDNSIYINNNMTTQQLSNPSTSVFLDYMEQELVMNEHNGIGHFGIATKENSSHTVIVANRKCENCLGLVNVNLSHTLFHETGIVRINFR